MNIANGYHYWVQGDVLSNQHQPPLAPALQTLPLLFLDLKRNPIPTYDPFNRAYVFLFLTNVNKLQLIMALTRSVSLFFGLGIGFLIFIIARFLSKTLALFTLGFWSFEPTLLAFSGVVVSDVPVAFFFLATILSYRQSLQNKLWKWSLITGFSAGMAVLCKYTALSLIPILMALEFTEYFRQKNSRKSGKAENIFSTFQRWAWGTAGFALSIFLIFLPATLQLRGHPGPYSLFVDALKDVTQHAQNPYPSFFMGKLSTERYWSYYPAAFLLKATVPLSILLILGALLGFLKKMKIEAWQWIPPLFVLLSILRVLDVGIRYLLPAFPFVILIAAATATWIWNHARNPRTRYLKILAGGFLLWHGVSVLAHFPHDISYFNDLIPSVKKSFWLGDSNLDFGQDLKRLAATARERGWPSVKLAYAGGVDPLVYGLKWERWTRKDLAGPQPGNIYAIEAGFFQVEPFFFPGTLPILRSWVTQIPPTGRVADTWYYFEIPGSPIEDTSPLLSSAPVLGK
jgi:hypothetical protein